MISGKRLRTIVKITRSCSDFESRGCGEVTKVVDISAPSLKCTYTHHVHRDDQSSLCFLPLHHIHFIVPSLLLPFHFIFSIARIGYLTLVSIMSTQSLPSDQSSTTPRSIGSPLDSSVPFVPISTIFPHPMDRAPPMPLFMPATTMSTTSPILGLRGEYNPELRNWGEWPRLAPTLDALGFSKGGISDICKLMEYSELTVFSSYPWRSSKNGFQL